MMTMGQALFDLFTPLTPQLNSFNTGLECKTHTLQKFSSLLPFVPQRCLSKPTAVDSSPLPSTARVTGGAGDALARHQNVPLDGNCIGVGNQSTESLLLTSATWWWNMIFGTIARKPEHVIDTKAIRLSVNRVQYLATMQFCWIYISRPLPTRGLTS